jgi:hypothetical protein
VQATENECYVNRRDVVSASPSRWSASRPSRV